MMTSTMLLVLKLLIPSGLELGLDDLAQRVETQGHERVPGLDRLAARVEAAHHGLAAAERVSASLR